MNLCAKRNDWPDYLQPSLGMVLLLQFWLAFLGFVQAQTRKDILINENWNFTYGYQMGQGNLGTRIDLPHTWNDTDVLESKVPYYRGTGIYEKQLFLSAQYRNQRLFLKFEGANTVADVFINGRHVGEHRGGYTAFTFEITRFVQWADTNEIRVLVNNAFQTDVMPLIGDFNIYGGIYRPVHLIVTAPCCITPLDYGSSGVYITPRLIDSHQADIVITTKINNADPYQQQFSLRTSILDARGNRIASIHDQIKVKSGSTMEKSQHLRLNSVRLWNGRQDPYLYQAQVELIKGDQVIDQVKQNFGVRHFHVDPNQGFFLNGQYLDLRGVCRHQDRFGKGSAISDEDHAEDMQLILELGANAIRLAHYPHAQIFVDLCDRNGLVAWAEIPWVGPGGFNGTGYIASESFHANARQQLIEMIRQNYNHPCICFWGIFNELLERGDNPHDLITELNLLAKKEDPTRLTTSATFRNYQINFITDVLGWNRYYGWYSNVPEFIGEWADTIHAQNPTRCIGLSEYGAGASIKHHQEDLKQPNMNHPMWHPEAWQAHFHEVHWRELSKRPYIWCKFIWNMFDFGAAHRREGDRYGINDKGLVTFDRKTKKDAFYFYKANWSDAPFVYIANRRFQLRKREITEVKVYSNLETVQLNVNGHSSGERHGSLGIFRWENVQLTNGPNTISVSGVKNGMSYQDQCTWILKDQL
jgi:beta-galactosidase